MWLWKISIYILVRGINVFYSIRLEHWETELHFSARHILSDFWETFVFGGAEPVQEINRVFAFKARLDLLTAVVGICTWFLLSLDTIHEGRTKWEIGSSRFQKRIKPTLESLDTEMALSNSPEKDIHDIIRTIKCNKCGINWGDKREEEKASKAQKGRETSTNV